VWLRVTSQLLKSYWFTCCTYLFLIIGKDKEPAKKVIVLSATRRGKGQPSRPHFSPNVATTPAI
jgi:hypothetical protein